jgi:2-polyprenyl-3-methyl-5-hydroxy-6-metoxy-1,4-benzoquinol methylase
VTETLPLTGERTAPGIWHETYWFARHEFAYHWVASLGAGRGGRVLDAGCGEGYGADLLRRTLGATVHGLDYDLPTLGHVRRSYPRIACLQGNLVRQALADSSYDLVVSSQTVEHLWDQPAFVAECARVVRPGGTVVVTTPNRLTFPPGNCYHTRELTAAELVELIAAELDVHLVAGVRHGPRITAWEASYGSCVDAQLTAEPAAWPRQLVDLVRGTSYDDFVITADDLDTSLDLVVVAPRR